MNASPGGNRRDAPVAVRVRECGFCHGQPVGDAASWLDGKPRPPAPCPRCGETNATPEPAAATTCGHPSGSRADFEGWRCVLPEGHEGNHVISSPDRPLLAGLPDAADAANQQERKRIYMVKRTLVERCFYDPDEIRREFGFPTAALPDESFDDFVIRVFERFEGSVYHDEFFPGDASPEVYTELEERWGDE